MRYRLYAPGLPLEFGIVRVGDDVIEIVDDGPARLVSPPGRPLSLRTVDVGAHAVDDTVTGSQLLVYADRFDRNDIAALRNRGWSGIDRAGQLVVSTKDMALVVERPNTAARSADDDSIALLRGRSITGATLGIKGTATARLTQLLLENPGRTWRATALAMADGRATVATASRLLDDLRRLGLCTITSEQQRSRWHRVVNPQLLLQWLADRTPPTDRRLVLQGYVRARDPETLVRLLARRIRSSSTEAVFTGAAATLIDSTSVFTSVPLMSVRVAPHYSLTDAADELGIDPERRGANIRLVSDRGWLATNHPRQVDDVPLAGVVRTWLDLRQERRGRDAAALYYDRVVAKEIGIER